MDDDESTTAPANDRLHDLDTIARRLNVATKTVRRMIARGELGYHQVGRLKRVSDRPVLGISLACKTGSLAEIIACLYLIVTVGSQVHLQFLLGLVTNHCSIVH